MARLISMEEFEQVIGMKCLYNGFVWDKSGKLFEVKTTKESLISSQPSPPYQNHRGYDKRNRFHAVCDKMTITALDDRGYDVVYDEYGYFIEVKEDTNSVKGEIYIRVKRPSGVTTDRKSVV